MRAASGGEQAAEAGGVDKSAAGEKEEKGCISVSAGCNWVAFRRELWIWKYRAERLRCCLCKRRFDGSFSRSDWDSDWG